MRTYHRVLAASPTLRVILEPDEDAESPMDQDESFRLISWAPDIRGTAPTPDVAPAPDRGSQYTSAAYQARLRHHGMQASVSRAGHGYDNACIESWHSLLKKELLYRHPWRTRDEATAAIFSSIEIFDNRQRVHSALGYRTPAACLAAGRSLRAAGAEDGARPRRPPISGGGDPRIFVVEFIDISPGRPHSAEHHPTVVPRIRPHRILSPFLRPSCQTQAGGTERETIPPIFGQIK